MPSPYPLMPRTPSLGKFYPALFLPQRNVLVAGLHLLTRSIGFLFDIEWFIVNFDGQLRLTALAYRRHPMTSKVSDHNGVDVLAMLIF